MTTAARLYIVTFSNITCRIWAVSSQEAVMLAYEMPVNHGAIKSVAAAF